MERYIKLNKMEEERNINLNEREIIDLKKALNLLIETEGDSKDYNSIINKLNTYYI